MKQWFTGLWARARAREYRLAIVSVGIVTVVMVVGSILWLKIQHDIATTNADQSTGSYGGSLPGPTLSPSSTEAETTSSTTDPTTDSPSSSATVVSESPAVTTTVPTTTLVVAATTTRPAPPRAPSTAYCRLDSGSGKVHYTKQAGPPQDPNWIETANDSTYLVWADSGFMTWQRVPQMNPNAAPEVQDDQAPNSWAPAGADPAEQASHANFVRLWQAGLADSPPCSAS
ncbi:MAG TPA: hypothetical protein VLI05_06985 [Candidatus Saccharimonadia bacterium]|nr:hypothetical protein [Candidatus Saccharimonadia bacterium]